jgi:hypothetical protein
VEYAEETVDDIVGANIDLSVPMEEWELGVLAKKMQQYCYLMDDVTEVSNPSPRLPVCAKPFPTPLGLTSDRTAD